jgi:hypothetical protein
VLDFVSPEWLRALAEEIGRDDATSFVLGQEVTGVPWRNGQALAYTIALGTGEVVAGTTEGATVTIVVAYPDAAAVAKGELSAADLLATGRAKLRGDIARLVEAGPHLERAGQAVARLAARTDVR